MFAKYAELAAGGAPVPEALILAAEQASKAALSPAEAETQIAELFERLPHYRCDARLWIACGMILEKRRKPEGMIKAWSDLQHLFPTHPLPLRMLLRWYRRSGQIEEGTQLLKEILASRANGPERVEHLLLGYRELNAHAEIDALMASALVQFPDNRMLAMRYIEALVDQQRFADAAVVAQQITRRDGLSQHAVELLRKIDTATVGENARGVSDASDAPAQAVACFRSRVPAACAPDVLGEVFFFTGQLGAGGAERQMTRIATALHDRWKNANGRIGGLRLGSPPTVCVRHASAANSADFFLPVLRQAKVGVIILADLPTPAAESLDLGDMVPQELFSRLPEDIQTNTRKLVRLMRAARPEVAYLWQDGGVLTGALAALIAGVPRIVTSFRGLPPNLRPELMRPQMPAFFKALASVPGVTFTSNSRRAASEYEAWLGLETGAITVIPNAAAAIAPHGDARDQARLAEIVAASPDCKKTVLGIFRLNQNKRPDFWIRIAAQYAEAHADTRFIILGIGNEHFTCERLIAELGAEKRVFLAGATEHVGYYLHRSDLLMHLAIMEGLPNAVIEAHLAGRPVLATPAGGTAEIVVDGTTGVLLSDNRNPPPEEVLQKLEWLLCDADRLTAMGRAARDFATTRFQIERVLEMTVAALKTESKGVIAPCAQC